MARIITATWDTPSGWLTILPNGELWICVTDGTQQRVYKSLNYGVGWTIEYDGGYLGNPVFGATIKVMPTSEGYVLTQGNTQLMFAETLAGTWADVAPPEGLDRQRGDMTKRTISGVEGIWVAAMDVAGLHGNYFPLSTDGGRTFD